MGYRKYGYYRQPTVAEQRAKAQRELAKLRKKDPDVQPVIVEGQKIAKTWWGQAWCENLESYADYANRIGRGRSYARNGMVLDLRLNPAPELFFTLRGVDPGELVRKSVDAKLENLLANAGKPSNRVRPDGDVARIFGL
jgi:uncharacterized Zn finger protein